MGWFWQKGKGSVEDAKDSPPGVDSPVVRLEGVSRVFKGDADENTYHRGAHVYTLISVSSDLKSIVLRNPWAKDGGGSDADPGDGYVTIPAGLAYYCSIGFSAYTV